MCVKMNIRVMLVLIYELLFLAPVGKFISNGLRQLLRDDGDLHLQILTIGAQHKPMLTCGSFNLNGFDQGLVLHFRRDQDNPVVG